MAAEPLLSVEALEAGYDEALILRGVSVIAVADQIVSIVGPNGAGKSTLLKAVYGLVRVSAGRVLFEGDDVTSMRPDRITHAGMNYVPQVDNVFPSLTISENLEVGAVTVPRGGRRRALDEAYELFPLLRERPRQRAGTLSGGQRKLLALARALVTRPRLLLLDEPSAGLSPQAVELVFAKLVEIRGLGIGMVEQNARRALALSDRGYVLDLGRNAHEGTGASLLDDPRVAELYLGSTSPATPSARTAME
jgi:ABC-type branched-subunit amino acid transport system ATPase component